MEQPASSFNDLPIEIQSSIFSGLDSLTIQKLRSASPMFRAVLQRPPHQHNDMVIPFLNNNGEGFSTAVLRTYEVYNCRDGGWITQLDFNLREENGESVGFMHPLTEADFDPELENHPRVFDVVQSNMIQMPSAYCLTGFGGGRDREIAFLPKSMWTLLEDFMILMIWGNGKLALYKSIDQTWGFIQHFCVDVVCVDVICYKGDFYALESTGRTFTVQADCTTEEIVGLLIGANGHKKRLVESGGDLLLVDQYYHNPDHVEVNLRRTFMFVVFRFVNEENSWVRIHTLGERVLFLGYHNRFSAAAVDVAGARGDLIYFSEAYDADMGDEEDEEDEEDEDSDEEDEDSDDEDGIEDDEGEDIRGPGSKDEGEEGREIDNEDDVGEGSDDVCMFDMVGARLIRLNENRARAVCFWPPPAWTANAAV